MLLTPEEIEEVRDFHYVVVDESITSVLFNPFWNALLYRCIPTTVAPNVLTLFGLFMCHAALCAAVFLDTSSAMTTLLVAACIVVYIAMDALDGKQARRTENSTPLGEILDHVCDSLSVVPITLSLLICLGVQNNSLSQIIVHTACANFLRAHVEAAHTGHLKFNKWTGPVEILVLVVLALLVRAMDQAFLQGQLGDVYLNMLLSLWSVQQFAILCFVATMIALDWEADKCHSRLYNSLILCILASTLHESVSPTGDWQQNSLVLLGLGAKYAVLSCEAIVCKMSYTTNRPVHWTVSAYLVVLAGLTIPDIPARLTTIGFCIIYMCTLVYQLCKDLDLPLLQII